MVRIKTVPIASLALAVSLSALLAACSTRGPSTVVVESPPQVHDRLDDKGLDATADASHSGLIKVAPRAFIDVEKLEANAPESYTVVRGDTLWDISDRFLKEPWRWTEIWNYNPQIHNPHLIFPGDKLALEYVNGKPTLTLTRNGRTPVLGAAEPSGNRVRLSPRVRSETLNNAIPTIPADSIEQFLIHPQVVDANAIESAPYVVGNYDNRLISAVGHQIYVRGQLSREQTSYGIYRRSKELRDPVNNDLLGFEIRHVADAKLLNIGDPSTLAITSNRMETIAGDILLPFQEVDTTNQYTPRLPDLEGDGRIVSLVNAIAQTGRNQVVVLNLGTQSNIQEGDVLAIETRGKSLIDPRGARGGLERVKMPNLRTGVVMVFKAFDKVSYALVMESTRPVMINDIITGI